MSGTRHETSATPPQGERRTHDLSLRASVRDGMANAVMLGSGEAYLGPLGIFLQATTLQIGLLATFPQLVGAALQWLGAVTIERFKSRRRMIVTGVVAQAFVWVPIGLLAVLAEPGQNAAYLLIVLAILYHGTAGLVTPVWNSLIGDLVPEDIRGRFFGRRNRLTGISTFLALLLAGGMLHAGKTMGHAAVGFLAIFAVAFAARLESARWLHRYSDPVYHVSPEQRFSFWQFLVRAPYSNFAKFAFFLATINFAVAFSGPYFALYMLRNLQMSYLEFTLVTAAAAISQFLTFGYWGRLTDRFGNKKILNVCGWGIGLVPILWLPSARTGYLILVQLVGGFVWAGFSLASANYLFDAVSPAKRARCAAYQGMINGVFVFAGSILGGFVAIRLPDTLRAGAWSWTPSSTLLLIFLISGLMRFVTAGIFLGRFRELRPVEDIRHRDLILSITQLRSIADATFSVLTGLFSRGDEDRRRNDKPR